MFFCLLSKVQESRSRCSNESKNVIRNKFFNFTNIIMENIRSREQMIRDSVRFRDSVLKVSFGTLTIISLGQLVITKLK
jgi:hypothetical protein